MHVAQGYSSMLPSKTRSGSWSHTRLVSYLFGAGLLAWILATGLITSGMLPDRYMPDSLLGTDLGGSKKLGERKILVLYVFAATDPEFLDNMRFFINEAVENDELCDYVFVVQQEMDSEKSAEVELPPLPPHARYVFHENKCYDWGTFGWLLSSGHVDFTKYLYFFFMNCSVRGPFYPPYARGRMHWTHPFIQRLRGKVKLVGPTISCEGSPLDGNMNGVWRRNPHVQSYVIATDRVGLRILRRDKHVFQCHSGRWNTIYHSELGSAAAIFKAGYNIDCLMQRYQGINWRDKKYWACNSRYSPQGENFVDGITLDPLEVMFVKVKSFTLMNAISYGVKAVKYGQWLHRGDPHLDMTPRDYLGLSNVTNGTTVVQDDILSNEFIVNTARFKVPKIMEAKARGPSCFDFQYYMDQSPELAAASTDEEILWRHFVYFGQFEGRPYRFTCPFDLNSLFGG